MKIGKIEVNRVAPDVVVVSQEIDNNELGCYVSKASDVDIRGSYLHRLACAIVDTPLVIGDAQKIFDLAQEVAICKAAYSEAAELSTSAAQVENDWQEYVNSQHALTDYLGLPRIEMFRRDTK